MIGRFDDDFVRAERPHPIVNSIGHPAGFAFDAIKGLKMRNYANLCRAVGRQLQQRLQAGGMIGAESATAQRVKTLTVSHTPPTARARALKNSHTENIERATH